MSIFSFSGAYLIIPLHQLCLKIENDSFAQNRFFFLEQCGLLGSDGKYSNQPVPVPRLTAESTWPRCFFFLWITIISLIFSLIIVNSVNRLLILVPILSEYQSFIISFFSSCSPFIYTYNDKNYTKINLYTTKQIRKFSIWTLLSPSPPSTRNVVRSGNNSRDRTFFYCTYLRVYII